MRGRLSPSSGSSWSLCNTAGVEGALLAKQSVYLEAKAERSTEEGHWSLPPGLGGKRPRFS